MDYIRDKKDLLERLNLYWLRDRKYMGKLYFPWDDMPGGVVIDCDWEAEADDD